MQNLWRAVLYQAMLDHINDKASNYISLGNKDFLMVCDLAGVNPARAIEKTYLMERGL